MTSEKQTAIVRDKRPSGTSVKPVWATVAFALCAGSWLSAAQAGPIKPPQPYNFNKSAYEKRLHAGFDGQVMGYETVLIKDGKVVAEVAGGLARNAADGKKAMTTSIPANIGSAIKFTGGVTLLQLFESKDKKVNPTGRSVEEWLSLPIYPYFPKIWQDGMHASIKKITFRHLLQHRSGFRGLAANELGGDGKRRMYDYLAAGVEPAHFDRRAYANANFSLLTYLIPMIADPALLGQVNKEAMKNNWKPEELAIHQRIANAWEQYITGQVYSKLTPAIHPSCNPKVDFVNQKRVWAPDYNSANDTNPGTTRDSRMNNSYCQAQGGWYITARELAAFVANFDATEKLVSAKTRELMFNNDKPDDRLVWSFTIPADEGVASMFHYKEMPFMGGDQGGAHASILLLPDGYYAVGIINSGDFSSAGVTRRLLRAFETGVGIPENPECQDLAKSISATGAEVAELRSELQAAQQDLADAADEGSKSGYYAKAVHDARQHLDAALDKLKGLQTSAEQKVCSL